MSKPTNPAPGRREPEQRKRAIVEAAAALITEAGTVDLTHRKVAARAGVSLSSTTYHFASLDQLTRAALEHLADGIDDDLAAIAAEFGSAGATAPAIAASLASYFADRAKVLADGALYVAGAVSPELRPLALRWFDGLVGLLSQSMPESTARAIAVWTDGAMMHAALNDVPLTVGEMEPMIAALMTVGAGEGTA